MNLADVTKFTERVRIFDYQDGQCQQKDPQEGGRMVEQRKAMR